MTMQTQLVPAPSQPSALARVDAALNRHALEPRNLAEAFHIAEIVVTTKFFPVKSTQEAMVMLMTGRELGLNAMQSLRGIYVVEGKPCLAADTMVAIIQSSTQCEIWQTVESNEKRCTIETRRRGWKTSTRRSWTIEDAQRAGLATKDVWKKYPADMLRHRCASALAREVYPDLILGMYTKEELEVVADVQPESITETARPIERALEPAADPPKADAAEAWRLKLEKIQGAKVFSPEVAAAVCKLTNGVRAIVWPIFAAKVSETLKSLDDASFIASLGKLGANIPPELGEHDAWLPVREAIERRRSEQAEGTDDAREPGQEG